MGTVLEGEELRGGGGWGVGGGKWPEEGQSEGVHIHELAHRNLRFPLSIQGSV